MVYSVLYSTLCMCLNNKIAHKLCTKVSWVVWHNRTETDTANYRVITIDCWVRELSWITVSYCIIQYYQEFFSKFQTAILKFVTLVLLDGFFQNLPHLYCTVLYCVLPFFQALPHSLITCFHLKVAILVKMGICLKLKCYFQCIILNIFINYIFCRRYDCIPSYCAIEVIFYFTMCCIIQTVESTVSYSTVKYSFSNQYAKDVN